MAWTLAVSAVATLAAGMLLVHVGAGLHARTMGSAPDGRAMRAFALWWMGVGASTVCVAGMLFAGLFPEPSAWLVAALRMLSLALLSAGLAGLLTHVAYVYTGRDHGRPVYAAYAILGAMVIGLILWSRPAFVDITDWTVETRGAHPAHPLVIPLFIAAYLLPPIVAGGLYLGLVRRATDAIQRHRIAVVGGGVLAWTAASLLARASDAALWQFLTRAALGVIVALLVARAYRAPDEHAAQADDELMRRVHQLV